MTKPAHPKMLGRFAAALVALVVTFAPARAEVLFDWGSEVYSELFDSYGTRLDSSYVFELGAFDPSFTPTAGNITSWAANWKVFDSTTINTTFDLFRSSAYMLDDGTSTSVSPFVTTGYDFRGLDAYIWGYNSKSYTQTLEWVWFRAPSWVFPASFAPGPPVTPTDWSISQLTAGDVPLFGRQATAVGLGYASAPGVLGQYNLQTYTLQPNPGIPEPSTVLVAVLLVGIAVFHRWQRVRAAKAAAVFALVAGFALSAEATRINFYSSPGVGAYGSDGRPLDEETSFELGVFANGFVPTAANTAQWSAHWVPAQRTKFATRFNWFSSVFNVTNNATPFILGAPAYVWGFSGSEAQGQWILFRSTKWTWPAADGSSPAPLLWSAKDADVVVLGSLAPANGGGVGLRSLAVANSLPPVTTWGQFQADKLPGSLQGDPADDADGDGIANVLEFALGTSPNSAAERPASPSSWTRIARGNDGKNYLEIRVPRQRNRAVNFSAELSGDLTNWAGGTNAVDKVEDTVEALTLRDKTPIGEGAPARFMRVKAAP